MNDTNTPVPAEHDPAFEAYSATRSAHWDAVARKLRGWKSWGSYYNRRLQHVYNFLIPANARILEIGSGNGDLLASLKPARGVGIDFSAEMVKLAQDNHPGLTFIQADAHNFKLDETFDAIILSEVVNDTWDVQQILENLRSMCEPGTRIILNYYSRVWEFPLRVARALNLAVPTLYQNWLTAPMCNLLYPARLFATGRKLLRVGIRCWRRSSTISGALLAVQPAHVNFTLARPAPNHWLRRSCSVSIVGRTE